MSSSAIVVVSPSLDAFITERERSGNRHISEGSSKCEYRLGRGLPASDKKCLACSSLFSLVDLSSSWTQRIDSGRLKGRSIEIVEAESNWKFYCDCDNEQRKAQSCVIRRYYASFTCAGHNYLLRDVTLPTPSSHPLPVMLAQILEFTTLCSMIHGNPTVSSISFLGKLPVPLRHKIPVPYQSRYLLQIDCTKSVESKSLLEERLGAINSSSGVLTIRAEASFLSFLTEYPQYHKLITLYLLVRGLFSFYTPVEIKEYCPETTIHILRGSGVKTLRQAFEEIKGVSIPENLAFLIGEKIEPALLVTHQSA